MLTVDPKLRPTAAQALCHPWLMLHVGSGTDSSPPPSPLHALRRPATPPQQNPQQAKSNQTPQPHPEAQARPHQARGYGPPQPQSRPQHRAGGSEAAPGVVIPPDQAATMEAAGWSLPCSKSAGVPGLRHGGASAPDVCREGTGPGGELTGRRGLMRESSSDSDLASSIEGGPCRVSTGLARAKAALQRLSLF